MAVPQLIRQKQNAHVRTENAHAERKQGTLLHYTRRRCRPNVQEERVRARTRVLRGCKRVARRPHLLRSACLLCHIRCWLPRRRPRATAEPTPPSRDPSQLWRQQLGDSGHPLRTLGRPVLTKRLVKRLG